MFIVVHGTFSRELLNQLGNNIYQQDAIENNRIC